jgi:hypothetical protein
MVSHPLVKGVYRKPMYLEVMMTELSPLIAVLTTSFDGHGARITFLAHVIVALIRVSTVNFAELATAFGGEAKTASQYRRIPRFFKDFSLSRAQVAAAVLRLVPFENPWIRCLDRTNWKFGAMNINILVFAVAYHGVALPLRWILLDKRGNSPTLERIALLKHVLVEFGHERIQCLTADREFIGTDWIKFLKRQRIRFCIRIRRNTHISNPHGTSDLSAVRFFQNLPLGEARRLPQPRRV